MELELSVPVFHPPSLECTKAATPDTHPKNTFASIKKLDNKVPRHPAYLYKIKVSFLDIFYITFSLSPSLYLSLSLPLSIFLSLSLSLSLSLTGEEGIHTLASIKHSQTHPLQQSERKRERKRERGREREREKELEGGERARPHPCKHNINIIPHSVNQSVSMQDYYINKKYS